MRVPEAYGNRNRNRRRLIWFIIEMDHPQSFGDFPHGRLHRPYTKLTCPSPTTTTTGARGPRFHVGHEVHHCERLFVRSPNWKKKHKLCLLLSISYIYTYYHYIIATGRTDDKPTVSLCTDDNGTPATWTLVLFQQAIDRQDRTPAEGRFSYWNHWRYNSLHRNLSHNRTRTRRKTTCLVGTYSIEATDPAGTTTRQAGRKLVTRRKPTSHRDSLRIVPGYSRLLHRSSRLPATTE